MLHSLYINDFVIVDEAEINFNHGFTVFSGETGAGKSILIDALSLALGARTNVNCVRADTERTNITAIFATNENINLWLDKNGIASDTELILRRTIDNQGRSRAYINGIVSTLGQLRELSAQLIDIHGQHAHQNLLKPSYQRTLLDNQAKNQALVKDVNNAWDKWQKAINALELAQNQSEQRQEQLERLQWQHSQIADLSLLDGEWTELNQSHSRLAHSQTILQGCSNALFALDNDNNCARSYLNQAHNEINNLIHHDLKLAEIADSIESALIVCADAVSELNHYCNDMEIDPDILETTEQRMSEVFNVARKLNVEPEYLPELQINIENQITDLQISSNIEELQKKADESFVEYSSIAKQLSETRQKTALKLSKDVSLAMQELAMSGGSFAINLNQCAPSKNGNETIEFLVAGHAGTKPMPLSQVASGGELARISLAISVIASEAAQVPTLIFDEVDSGIGGKVAEIVGKLLQKLGQKHQVLCVTHLAQVAACAKHHYVVSKHSQADTTLSNIRLLDMNQRIDEIARMLGGIKITSTTRKHATEMLQG